MTEVLGALAKTETLTALVATPAVMFSVQSEFLKKKEG